MPINGEEYFKDIKQIFSRLFDHKAVIQGEIKFIANEFEEKSLTKDSSIEIVLAQQKQLNCTIIPECISYLDVFKNLNESISNATEKCYKVTNAETPDKEFLMRQRRLRAEEWSKYLDELAEKCKQVDLQYTEDLNKLAEHYKNLETQLH